MVAEAFNLGLKYLTHFIADASDERPAVLLKLPHLAAPSRFPTITNLNLNQETPFPKKKYFMVRSSQSHPRGEITHMQHLWIVLI